MAAFAPSTSCQVIITRFNPRTASRRGGIGFLVEQEMNLSARQKQDYLSSITEIYYKGLSNPNA